MDKILCIMFGGGIGAVLRYLVSNTLNNKFKLEHWATFWVNITGCLLLGFVFELLLRADIHLNLFIIAGLIGSYTTFSTFEYENINLIAHEKYYEFIKYSTLSCVLGFAAIATGYKLAAFLT